MLIDADLFIVMVTPQAIESDNVRDEIHFARSHKRPTLAIHLEETRLPPGLELSLSSRQALMRWQIDDATYVRKLTEFPREMERPTDGRMKGARGGRTER